MSHLTRSFSRTYFLYLAGLLLICVGLAAQEQNAGKEPISFIGHGALFDRDGKEVAPTPEFLQEAQAWYRNDLLKKLTEDQQAQFVKLESRLSEDLDLDDQSQLILSAYLLDRLIEEADIQDGGRTQGKNNLMKRNLKSELPGYSNIGYFHDLEPFSPDPDLARRLAVENKARAKPPGVEQLTTGTNGAAYRALCQANGVPIPPDIGTSGWISRGTIPMSDLFIVTTLGAEVFTYESTSPAGLCIALPRYNASNVVQLDGVICFGKVSSKACFWDSTSSFTLGATVSFNSFAGGTDLVGGSNGFCSDCHAGENPYIIHDATLNSLAGILPTFPDNWPDPIVRTGDTLAWPENPGPMNAPAACASCHYQGGAGRFPHLSTALPGYCNSVLQKSIDNTMPPGAPGSLAADPDILAFKAWCGVAPTGDTSDRGDPHITTFNGIKYDFQGAGEYVALRNAGGLEIQARQEPVASTFVPGPNAHTGLTNCPSLNTAVAARVGEHRVTYQPDLGGVPSPNGLDLRVDGVLTVVDLQGLNLGNGGRVKKAAVGDGIEIEFPDGTDMIVTSKWWTSQSKWYLNIDVSGSSAREGIMGAVLPRTWLPSLPDGTTMGPIPATLHQRYLDLYQTFNNAWRVTNLTSLFDYAPGTSTGTFTNPGWPPEFPPCVIPDVPPVQSLPLEDALMICAPVLDEDMNAECVFDVQALGEPTVVEAYLDTQKLLAGATKITLVDAQNVSAW
jgi:hypothetical protein